METIIRGKYYTETEELAATAPNATVTGGRFVELAATKSGKLRVDVGNGAVKGLLFPWSGKASTTMTGTDGAITVSGSGASKKATMTSATMQFSSVQQGQSITITDAVETGNSGIFTITEWTSTTISWTNANAAASTGVSWSYAGNYVIATAALNKFGSSVDKAWTKFIVSPGGGQISLLTADSSTVDTFTMIAGWAYPVGVKEIKAANTTVFDLQIGL